MSTDIEDRIEEFKKIDTIARSIKDKDLYKIPGTVTVGWNDFIYYDKRYKDKDGKDMVDNYFIHCLYSKIKLSPVYDHVQSAGIIIYVDNKKKLFIVYFDPRKRDWKHLRPRNMNKYLNIITREKGTMKTTKFVDVVIPFFKSTARRYLGKVKTGKKDAKGSDIHSGVYLDSNMIFYNDTILLNTSYDKLNVLDKVKGVKKTSTRLSSHNKIGNRFLVIYYPDRNKYPWVSFVQTPSFMVNGNN